MKTDNANLPAKLALRRYFMERYHFDGQARVLDACQGSGKIWGQLRKEFEVASYLGLDVKPSKGRLRLDSVRYLRAEGWRHDVLDFDTYGSPWRHWEAALPRICWPATVFLTLGLVRIGGGQLSREQVRALGCQDFQHLRPGLQGRIAALQVPYCLKIAGRYGLEIVEAKEAPAAKNARYFGVRLEPVA